MTRLTQFFLLLLLATAISLSACKNDDDDGVNNCGQNFNYALELQAEATALSNTAAAFSNDPTTVNCEAYRTAASAYLDAASDITACVPTADQVAYNQSIVEAQAQVDSLMC